MKTEVILNSETLEKIHSKLGASRSAREGSLSLIEQREDHVWIWNEKGE